ncbi:MAG: activator of HSP90 ATPase [Parvicella sp.]|jgi:activator of HSP90 ATPase
MNFTITTTINAKAEAIYNAWLNSEQHSQMTGGEAIVSDKVDGTFWAWDGYIEGKNIELIPFNKIVQLWRTAEFKENEIDSTIELTLEETNGSTLITLVHSNLSEAGEQYIEGWKDNYFTPMAMYFNK